MRLLLTIAILLLSGGPGLAYRQNVGNWEISYFPSDRPIGCIMGGTYESQTRFSIIVTTRYEWALGLSNPAWNLRQDGTTDVAVFVDQKFIVSGKAKHWDKTIAVLQFANADAFRPLQIGRRLDLAVPGGNLSFALTGTGKAMYALLDCVKTLMSNGPQLSQNGQTAKAPSPPSADFQMVPLAEATVMLTNFFNAAGVRGWSLESPKQGDVSVGFRLAGGSIGFFRAARGNTPTADDHATFVISRWSEICKGKYLSGRQAVPSTDGSVVRKIVTTCSMESGRDSATETTIIRQADGFLLELTQIMAANATAAPPSDPDKQDHEAVVNAVLRKR